jgi:hypothetical protein
METNAKAFYHTFSVVYKYKVINQPSFSVVPGIGAGILTHSQDYPYVQGSSIQFRTSSWSDLVFPVSLDMAYKPFDKWQVGITAGFLIHPDYPVLGLHAGPRISYVLK